MVAAGFMATGAMAQSATFKYFSYEVNDSRFDKTIDNANEYFNPVMAGFYPDPSICRRATPTISSTRRSRSSPECLSSRARTSSTGSR